jgi:hypothetical protein
MLTGAAMGGMEEMGVFYDSCLQELYPPGQCGTFCNEHTFECFVAEIQEACCTDAGENCGDSVVPQTCPVGCAIVFPEFMETCRGHMGNHPELPLAEFEAFEQTCLELDGLALVEYAMDLINNGCMLDLRERSGAGGHRRFLQALAGWISTRFNSDSDICPFDDLDDNAMDVDYACCGIGGCSADGPPATCTPGCAVALHQFTSDCGETLGMVLAPNDPLSAQIETFEALCMDTVSESTLFLDAIMGAVCPEFGRTVLVNEIGADARGWSNEEVTEVGSAGVVHGPYGNDVVDVTRTVPLPEGITSCEVSWRSWAIDSRDNEVDWVQIDGVEVWSQPVTCPGEGWEIGPPDFPNPWGGEDDGRVCFQEHTYEAPCSGSIELHFHSGIDQAESDEGWAFSDVSVIGATGEQTLLAEDEMRGALETGWTSTEPACPATEVTDVGSAGLVHGPWGNDCTSVSIELPVPADMGECEVSWVSWAIDSRDGEVDSVNIDGVEVWANPARCWGEAGEGWELGPNDFPNPYGGQADNQVCRHEVTVNVRCSVSIRIDFLSGIDQGEADESWAFSGVRVISRPAGAYGNAAQEARTLHQELGADPAGWSNGEVTEAGSAGLVHGPYGSDVTEVSIDIPIPAGLSSCEVRWRSWAIDSRDGEVDSVQIDGTEVWAVPAGTINGCGVDGWEQGPPDFPNPWGGQDDNRVCSNDVVVEVPCHDTLSIHFLSGIDQSEDDESWAFSNVQVVAGYGEVTLLAEDEQNGAVADGWTNAEVTDVGSAGLVHGPWGNDCTDVSIDVTIPAGNTECEVSWVSWAIDSRDNEVDSVQLDGVEVWANAARCWGEAGEGWELGPGDFPNPYGGQSDDQVCRHEVTVQVPCSGTLHVNFLSGIDQAEDDESWAFSDVRVIARP